MVDLPAPDDLMAAIDADQKSLGEMDKELQAAIIQYRDGRYQVLVADAKLKSVKATIDIVKARMMGRMALLKSYPR